MHSIQQAIYDDPEIATKSLKEQFDRLLLQPILGLRASRQQVPSAVIVIDALDECEREDDVRLIIQLLSRLGEADAIRLRVFLTSRPELPIRLGFLKIAGHHYQDVALHDISDAVTERDISLFLDRRLSQIRTDRLLPVNWPGDTEFRALVNLSVPLFIFAATVCRIFEDPQWDPLDSLNEILTRRNEESKLDKTYLPVLNRLFNNHSEKRKKQLVQEFREIVGTIVMLESPLSILSLSKLTGLSERLVAIRLNSLHSVIRVPEENTLPVRLFHLSFRDFCLDPETLKKTPLWVDKEEMHQKLATQLRSKHPGLMIHDALLFLQNHFLHWVEAMSILGLLSEVVEIIDILQSAALQGDRHYELSDFLQDAKRFVLKNRQIAHVAPLQIYCSGLVFAPRKSIIRRESEKELPQWICRFPDVEDIWSAELQTLEGHSDWVFSVAFSLDGGLLASGSSDNTVRLWDPITGTLQQTLEGHSDWVRSVTFSPDGRLMASASSDNTIRLWDTATGSLQQTLEGHLGSVWSVAFSPDGQILASGSYDQTMRIWDLATCTLRQTLKGHLGSVQSVAFSPDGRLLASASGDNTIRLWDPATGSLQQTLEGHLGSVWSVAFSPDGQLLASGSSDQTIRLWNASTGTIHQTLEGHLDWLRSVVFSPDDGRLLASSDNGQVVRLWDTITGTLVQKLEGHVNSVWSVAFSPDGRLLASGSYDQTVRLWDPAAGNLQRAFESHSARIRSVVFSPDGRLLASSSDDQTVRLWDPITGNLQQTLKGHSGSVLLVAFSPDSRLLASGSIDQTVRLWDPATGTLLQTLEGHSDWLRSLVFSPDSRLLASSSDDRTVRLWDTASGTLLQKLTGHSDWIRSVAFSTNGRLLASSSDDRTVRLWNTATGALQQTLKGHSDWVRSVAFSPDGLLLASGSYDQTVRIWDLTTSVLQWILKGHSSSVRSVAFSPDGLLVASSSDDQTVRLWDPATGNLQQTLMADGVVTDLRFSDDGHYLRTNLGSLVIQPSCSNCTPNLGQMHLEIFMRESQWITMNGKKVLWLPPESRSSCSAIIGVNGCLSQTYLVSLILSQVSAWKN
ncbi:hypothetical protein EYZ11_012821 [Aspergillus tanneri]|uniref:Mitochondrial division protein 1 n=1 Tax=Aspergillus tanneri TaxID=1220188 RepID=A0A4S3IZR7_9EURO|nr:hypothetical protein EYZ11_012821 [Aspergillus tanneri]